MPRTKTIKVAAHTRKGVRIPAHARVIADKPKSRVFSDKIAQRHRFGGQARTVFHRVKQQKRVHHRLFDPQAWVVKE